MLSKNFISKKVQISLFALLLASCGDGTPDEVDATNVFKNQFNSILIQTGQVNVDQLKKTNGQSSVVLGVEVYALFYEAAYSFPEGFNLQCSPEKVQELQRKQMKNNTWSIGGPAECQGKEYRSVGEVVETSGKFMFEKTEKGWRGPDGNYY
jgi:hypothetical protein